MVKPNLACHSKNLIRPIMAVICSTCIGLPVQKPDGPIMAVIISTSIGLSLKKINWDNNGCHRLEWLPQKLFAHLRFLRMFTTDKILFLAKGLCFRNTCSMKQCKSSKQMTNCWDIPLPLARTKGIVSDVCRQTTNVIFDQEVQPLRIQSKLITPHHSLI